MAQRPNLALFIRYFAYQACLLHRSDYFGVDTSHMRLVIRDPYTDKGCM